MRYAITLDHRLITDGYKERVTKQKSMHTLNQITTPKLGIISYLPNSTVSIAESQTIL